MGTTFRSIAFWAASIVSAVFLLVVIAAALWAYLYVHAHPPAPGEEHMGSLVIIYGILLIIAGALFFSVYFGWGRERREARQLQQQMATLRRQLEEFAPANQEG